VWLHDERLLARCGSSLIVWDVAGGKPTKLFRDRASLEAIALSPDGRELAALDGESLRFIDVGTGTERKRVAMGVSVRHDVAFTADGKTVATLHDKGVVLVDVASGKLLRHSGTLG